MHALYVPQAQTTLKPPRRARAYMCIYTPRNAFQTRRAPWTFCGVTIRTACAHTTQAHATTESTGSRKMIFLPFDRPGRRTGTTGGMGERAALAPALYAQGAHYDTTRRARALEATPQRGCLYHALHHAHDTTHTPRSSLARVVPALFARPFTHPCSARRYCARHAHAYGCGEPTGQLVF